ncbi:MAG: hypothetical protein LUE64_03950 [Candidatus Gastranaerophilales bacterium]|nr:hypothetical protein [Candidatus Gastranaerophilales bacterium]
MFSGLVSLINKTMSSATYTTEVKEKSNNPFASADGNNPYVSLNFGSSSENYAKNQPVAGGYFAGYYNGVPNIVGRKLFIEV